MTFEQQIRDLTQAATRQIAAQLEEHLAGLVSECSQAAASDRASVMQELRLAADAEAAKRSQEAVAAARAELDRQREAELTALQAEVSSQIDAAVAAALARARDEADARVARLVEEMRSEREQITRMAVADALDADRRSQVERVSRINAAIQRLDAAESLTGVLDALADSAGFEAPRVAVFVLRGSRLTGWRYSGFSPDVSALQMEIAVDAAGLLNQALQAGKAVATSDGRPGDTAFVTPFGAMTTPHVGLAVPVRIGGETVAVVYADNLADDGDASTAFADGIDVLARHAARCLEVLTFARAAARAPVRRPSGLSASGDPAPKHSSAVFSPANLAAAGFAPSVPQPPTAATVPDAPPMPRYAPQTRAFQPTGDEEEDSARRYARLLVSEIKLYHEAAVVEGRRNRSLLERLRPEIERAQHLYEERVPVQVRLRSDFFGQELVRTLAGGDPTLLGAR